ncbi:MAG: cyclic nucleotide-binding domain-containing protein [Candidatus Wallbacteria bacterium]|nr:cyclic nucleotide-binding domain-containing protein [Candidatus Wallbacteria bacterium]
MSSLEELAGLSFFKGISKAQLGRLAAVSSSVCFPAGRIVFQEGEDARDVYFVLEGRVAIEIAVPGRGVQTTMTVGKGEVFGWSAFVPPHEETAAARALEPVTALVLGGLRLRQVCETDLELGYRIASGFNQALASRLAAMRLQLLDLYGIPGDPLPEEV